MPNIRDQDLLAFSGENLFDRPNQSCRNALVADTVVNNQFAQIGPEPEIVGANKTKNQSCFPRQRPIGERI